MVSEAFELFDEAFGLAFGVAGGEVIGAEVAVVRLDVTCSRLVLTL